jgi:hypothetical protein
MRESDFQTQVIQFARLCGWTVAHFRPAQLGGRWLTPVQADGKGFPDLVLARDHPALPVGQMIVAELKVEGRKPKPEQIAWLTRFEKAGIPAYVWQPRDWPEIETVLRA